MRLCSILVSVFGNSERTCHSCGAQESPKLSQDGGKDDQGPCTGKVTNRLNHVNIQCWSTVRQSDVQWLEKLVCVTCSSTVWFVASFGMSFSWCARSYCRIICSISISMLCAWDCIIWLGSYSFDKRNAWDLIVYYLTQNYKSLCFFPSLDHLV
jgi:hypothetical protein